MQQSIKKITDEAIQVGFDNANSTWKEIALENLRKLCISKEEISADDLRDSMVESSIGTHDRRAVGGLMRTAKKNGWCEPTGVHVPSRYTHGHLHQIWRSKIYKPIPSKTLF